MAAPPNYQAMAVAAAQQYGIDPQVFLRQINQESGFNPNARSGAGAEGIAQFMPSTASAMGVDPMNPQSALYGAAKLDSQNLQKYGSMARALSAYNSGRPDAYLDPGFANGQTYNYVRDILGASGGKASKVSIAALQKTPTAAPTAGALTSGSSPQQALAAMMLQQSAQTLAGGKGQPSPMSNLLDMAMARQQLGAAQQTYGSPSTSVDLGGFKVHGVQPQSPQDAAAVKAVQSFIGTPYEWGGASPKGFDCSGLLQYVWGKQGVNIPRTTFDQWKVGQAVNLNALRPGDAVFFKGSDSQGGLPGHVGMYIGGGRIVEAPHTGASVQISNLAGRNDIMGARRYA